MIKSLEALALKEPWKAIIPASPNKVEKNVDKRIKVDLNESCKFYPGVYKSFNRLFFVSFP